MEALHLESLDSAFPKHQSYLLNQKGSNTELFSKAIFSSHLFLMLNSHFLLHKSD